MPGSPLIVPEWIQKYYAKNFKLVYYPTKQKNPIEDDWPIRQYTIEDYSKFIDTYGECNVGIKLGSELTPGRFLVDIDFDWEEGANLSGNILPPTRFVYGRKSKPISHAFYTSPEPLICKKYENIQYEGSTQLVKSKQCFVELRGVTNSGELGAQSMAPPSIWVPKGPDGKPDKTHPGEIVEFYKSSSIDADLGHSDILPRRTLLFAIACLFHAWIPKGTLKHDMRLAMAGFLLASDLNKEETTVIMKNLIEANGPHDKGDEVLAIDSTLRRIAGKKSFAGKSALIELLGEYGIKILAQITKWLGGTDFIEHKGKPIPNQENIRRSFEIAEIKLSYNEFSNKSMIYYPGDGNGTRYEGVLEDNIRRKVWLEMESKYRFLPMKTLCYDVMDDASFENRYHPVLDYLNTLKWDGEHRLETWIIKCADAIDIPYVRAVSSLMLVAAVRRVVQPGCKFDEMVILESGTQGLLKSSALRALCVEDEWFSDSLSLNLKPQEIIEMTAGKWIIEIQELNKLKSTQMEQIKSLLSRQDDTARLAYRHDAQSMRRQSIFIGTTNSYTYLSDQTGNRRFWPIRVKKFNIPMLKEIRDQLWAEAYYREQMGESIRLPEELYKQAEEQQTHRLVDDDWRTILDMYFEKQHQRVAYDEIWEQIGVPTERRDNRAATRLAEVLQSLGFIRATTVRNKHGKVSKGWKRDFQYSDEEWEKMRTPEETDSDQRLI